MNFIWLMFGHFIGDWGLQSDWMGKNKAKHWFIMFAHCMIYTGIISIVLKWLGILQLWKIPFVFIGHYATDSVKGKFAKSEKDWWMIYPDHFIHFIQLICILYSQ